MKLWGDLQNYFIIHSTKLWEKGDEKIPSMIEWIFLKKGFSRSAINFAEKAWKINYSIEALEAL